MKRVIFAKIFEDVISFSRAGHGSVSVGLYFTGDGPETRIHCVRALL